MTRRWSGSTLRSACPASCVVDTVQLHLIKTVATEPGAHTIGWNSVHHRLYASCPPAWASRFSQSRSAPPGESSARTAVDCLASLLVRILYAARTARGPGAARADERWSAAVQHA